MRVAVPTAATQEGGRAAAGLIESVHRHAGVGPRAAVMVLPVTAEGELSSWGLVGRDQELAALLALLDPRPEALAGAVASVLAGMAGVGKTALAWRAARTAVGRGWFPGGAVIVDLHGHDSDPAAQVAPERVYASLLRALDPDLRIADLPATVDEQASAYHCLMSHLDQVSRPVLLVVDNIDDTYQITGLLPTGRSHRVLITSRHLLEGLPGARRLELDVLPPELAIELLGTRRPGDLRLSADPAATAELARLCGHLPLALQIIAVLMADDPARSTAELVAELAAELAEETTRPRGLPWERWPGRAAVKLAYRRLDDPTARLFRLLAAVPAPDVAAEAAAALADQPVEQVRQTLAVLTRAHLLECHQLGRWRMPDLIRGYATELATVHAQHDRQDQAISRLLAHHRDTTHAVTRVPAHCGHAVMDTKTIGVLARTLHSAQVEPTDLSAASRVGGASRVPLVAQARTPHRRPPITDSRQRRHWLLRTTTALVVAIAATVLALLKPFIVDAGTGAAGLVLSTSQVKIGDNYFATASGFSPGERVRFSWSGPSDGVMGVFPADSSGGTSLGPVFERHPPGNYAITVTGLTSGRTVSAGLRVVTGVGAVRLVLSTSQVKIGDTYFATAWGFAPGEDVKFSINRANDVIGVYPADSGGSRWHGVLAKEPPGNYTITVTGLTSGRTASARLRVAQSGS